MKSRHVMIRASAGSGKTYALTTRFVALLAEGASPERIVALTFTRKAAGEFFDEILGKLARAAGEDDFAGQLAADVGRPELGCADFLRLLRAVVDAMPRLRLGTLDGFFARIVRAFPLELGLAGDFEVLQEHTAAQARRRVLHRIFSHEAGGLDEAQRAFVENFKRATFGTEEKQLARRLDRLIDEHLETFLAAPAPELWGEPARIWSGGCEWLGLPRRKLSEVIASLRATLAGRDLSDKQRTRFEVFFVTLAQWTPGGTLPREIEYIMAAALAVWQGLHRGAAELVVERRKLALGPDECADLIALVTHTVGLELQRRLEVTRGIHAVLRAYDSAYDESVRREGKLTFGDVLRLLMPESGAPVLETGDGRGEGRLQVDYRLDARFDHWLLDEFQDTSFGQWSVLRNLIDEVVQDPAGARSFFCVGDVKQGIYAWRGGDPALFRDILERYNRSDSGAIAEEHLVASWRSGPAIIEMVNAVFGRGEVIAGLFPGTASESWSRDWRAHVSARPTLNGQAAWLHADDEEARFALTVRLLREIAPAERGLECAVLVRKNETATALAEYLRQMGGIPALAESDLHIATDNPLGTAVLALLQVAAHPGDHFAREHLAMTPLATALAGEGVATPALLTERVLGQIHVTGFEKTLAYWLGKIEPVLSKDDDFSRERSTQLIAAAAAFDETGNRTVADFVAFMKRHTIRDTEVAGVVKVMTVHKAKGLGFDVVILPELDGNRIDERRKGLAVARNAEREVEWVLDFPPAAFCAGDPVLRGYVRSEEMKACHEAFALLYVAMTRAKRAMYLITKRSVNSTSLNYPRLLTETLGGDAGTVAVGGFSAAGGWSTGDARWHESVGVTSDPAPAASTVSALPPADRFPRAPRRPARRPSADRQCSLGVKEAFSAERAPALVFGIQVHALLADVEWREAQEPPGWARPNCSQVALEEARSCVFAQGLDDVWMRSSGSEVWRERAFEVVIDGAWVAGVFDRVIVESAADGAARRVRVFDFKTERVGGGEELRQAVARHRGQLNLYRRVAALLAGVSEVGVSCEIIFTGDGARVAVPPP